MKNLLDSIVDENLNEQGENGVYGVCVCVCEKSVAYSNFGREATS